MVEEPKHGAVQISELAGSGGASYEAHWYARESGGADRAGILESCVLADPRTALAWARDRAPVVLVERTTADGRATTFTAGDRPPSWNPRLPILDEEAMIACRPATMPSDGDAGWVRLEPLDESFVAGALELSTADEPTVARPPAIDLHHRRGLWPDELGDRLDTALDAVSSQTIRGSLDDLAAHIETHGLVLGDDELGGDVSTNLHAVFLDHASEGAMAYLLVSLDQEGRVKVINAVQLARTIAFRTSSN